MPIQKAKFSIGDIVKHKHFEFRGVIYDVDFEFNNSHPKSESGIDFPIIFFNTGSLVKYFPKYKAKAKIIFIMVGFT